MCTAEISGVDFVDFKQINGVFPSVYMAQTWGRLKPLPHIRPPIMTRSGELAGPPFGRRFFETGSVDAVLRYVGSLASSIEHRRSTWFKSQTEKRNFSVSQKSQSIRMFFVSLHCIFFIFDASCAPFLPRVANETQTSVRACRISANSLIFGPCH